MLFPNKKNSVPKCFLVFCICLGWVFLLLHCTKEKKPPSTLASDFTLKTIDDQEITLSQLKGKVVLLDFWATWCGPCRESTPHFIHLYKTYRESGFEIIGISLDKGGSEVVRNFARSMEIPYPIVIGSEKVIRDYQVTKIPTSFLIDKEGKIRESIIGFNSVIAQQLTAKVIDLTSEKP